MNEQQIELKLKILKFVKELEGNLNFQLADEIYNWLNEEEKQPEVVDDKIYPSNSPTFDKDNPKFEGIIKAMNRDYHDHKALKEILIKEDKAPEPENIRMNDELLKEILGDTEPFENLIPQGKWDDLWLPKKDVSVVEMDSEDEVALLMEELEGDDSKN